MIEEQKTVNESPAAIALDYETICEETSMMLGANERSLSMAINGAGTATPTLLTTLNAFPVQTEATQTAMDGCKS